MLPNRTKEEVRRLLWAEADRLDWPRLSAAEKSGHYRNWTNSPQIGGRLAAFMDPRQVRVYIKDTSLKAYTRERSDDFATIRRILGIQENESPVEVYIKPHGRRMSDGKLVAWSKASEWKLTLLALHERAYGHSGVIPYAAILSNPSSKFGSSFDRLPVQDAADKLGIKKLIWLD